MGGNSRPLGSLGSRFGFEQALETCCCVSSEVSCRSGAFRSAPLSSAPLLPFERNMSFLPNTLPMVLSPTRWKIRKAVKAVNEVLGSLGLLKHPDKTFVGKTERGFDFLGYHFGPEGFTMAAKTIEQFVARAIRLYEQEPGEACASSRLGL